MADREPRFTDEECERMEALMLEWCGAAEATFLDPEPPAFRILTQDEIDELLGFDDPRGHLTQGRAAEDPRAAAVPEPSGPAGVLGRLAFAVGFAWGWLHRCRLAAIGGFRAGRRSAGPDGS